MKRMMSVLLAVALVLGMIPATLAAGSEHQTAADRLYRLGLVSGTGTDANGNPIYELDRAPTRSEAITVLVKLLGKAEEASRGGWDMPFTDVPGWAQNFVGYAYANGLTSGTSATTFGGEDPVTAAQYITFVLKALGYSANGDFQWDKAWELSDRLGFTGGRYDADTASFLRGDVFFISEAALHINVKNGAQTLAQQLIDAGVFTTGRFNQVYDIPMEELTSEQIFDRCSPAVFFIEVYDKSGKVYGTGSGFFINSNGLAVTNHHVLDGAERAVITTSDTKQKYEVTGVYDFDNQDDWVVMQVDGTGFASLEIGAADTIKGGATVFAIGSPKGLQNTISQGLISNPDRELDGVHYIQTSAPISAGSSGGALINKYGQVIGITSAGFTDGQNLNLAMPITVIEGCDTSELCPVSAVTPKPLVTYTVDKTAVTVPAGSSVLVSMDAEEFNVEGNVTYSLKIGDKSIATVGWDDMDDEYLPWDIRITGIKAGKTTLTIYNNKTEDVATVSVTVTPSSASVSYQLGASSVTVAPGAYELVSLNVEATGISETITYSVESGDTSIATVVWDDMEDQELPWDIRVTGVKVGKTTLNVRNDKTADVISIPITVAEAVATDNQAAVYKVLKDFVLKNYTTTISNGKYKTFEYEDEDVTYQLIFDPDNDAVMVREMVRIDRQEYVSYISLDAESSRFASMFYVYPAPYNAYSFKGARTIVAAAFHKDSTADFTEYEGRASGEKDIFRGVANLLIENSLEFINIVLKDVCETNYSAKDFGFSNISLMN